jgi:hypothetical protein
VPAAIWVEAQSIHSMCMVKKRRPNSTGVSGLNTDPSQGKSIDASIEDTKIELMEGLWGAL